MTTDINNFDDLYPGRFLKAGMFNGQPATFTIKAVQHDEIEGDKGLEKIVVLGFQETPFEHKLPKVNAVAIKAMFGAQVQEWIGKRVTLYGTTAIMPFPKKRDEPCIRVFGSPDISAEVRCEWTPPRRKAVVQILKPMQSPVLTAALAAIEAAPDDAPMGKFQERANQLLVETKINDQEHATITEVIQQRIQRVRAAEAQPPAKSTGAGPATADGAGAGQQPKPAPDGPQAEPEAAAVNSEAADPSKPSESDAAAGEPAAAVDLKLRDRQQLIRSVNALPPDRKAAFLALVSLDGAPQLKTEAHANAFTQFLAQGE